MLGKKILKELVFTIHESHSSLGAFLFRNMYSTSNTNNTLGILWFRRTFIHFSVYMDIRNKLSLLPVLINITLEHFDNKKSSL